jgi:hypothetical protein
MGKPSDRKGSAQRLGRRERARVKKHRRSEFFGNVDGAGNVHAVYGRKHEQRFRNWLIKAHLVVLRQDRNPETPKV